MPKSVWIGTTNIIFYLPPNVRHEPQWWAYQFGLEDHVSGNAIIPLAGMKSFQAASGSDRIAKSEVAQPIDKIAHTNL